MHDAKNITKTDMRFFQNDMLTDLKKLELQINGKISNISQTISSKSIEYDSKFTKISENITELIGQLASRKFDNERVEELLNIKDKLNEQIIENQSRILIIDKKLEDSIFRYDKIIIDNLHLPGIIGTGCPFKNCASFFENINNELRLNKKYKEQEQLLSKTFHEKVDSKIFKIENELKKMHQSINHICTAKFEKYLLKFEQRLQITENMINATRLENSKYAEDLIQSANSLKIQWERLENIKNEIYEKFYEELDIFKKVADSTNRNFYKQNNEFKIFKQRFTQLAEYLKEFRNQKNRDYKELKKNIDFTKKQILKNGFDIENYNKIGDDVQKYIKSPSPKRIKEKYNLNEESNKESFSSFSNKNDKKKI